MKFAAFLADDDDDDDDYDDEAQAENFSTRTEVKQKNQKPKRRMHIKKGTTGNIIALLRGRSKMSLSEGHFCKMHDCFVQEVHMWDCQAFKEVRGAREVRDMIKKGDFRSLNAGDALKVLLWERILREVITRREGGGVIERRWMPKLDKEFWRRKQENSRRKIFDKRKNL